MNGFDVIQKFIHFAWRYEVALFTYEDRYGKHTKVLPLFIQKINWSCDVSHIIDIWENKVLKTTNTDGYIIKFFSLLDDQNQHSLVDYIMNEFEKKIKDKVKVGDILLNEHASENNPHRKSIVYEVTKDMVYCVCVYKGNFDKIQYNRKEVNEDDAWKVINHVDIKGMIKEWCK